MRSRARSTLGWLLTLKLSNTRLNDSFESNKKPRDFCPVVFLCSVAANTDNQKPPSDEGGGFLRSKKTEGAFRWTIDAGRADMESAPTAKTRRTTPLSSVLPRRRMGAEAFFKMTQVQGQTYANLVSQDAVLRNTGLRACASVRTTGFSQPPSFRLSSLARRVQVDRRSPGRLGWILKEGNRNPSLSDSFATLF